MIANLLFLLFSLSSACELKFVLEWDCSDDNPCNYYASCRKTGTWPNFYCVCADVRCDNFNLTTGACIYCKPGYQPTAHQRFCSPPIPQCQVYSDDFPLGFCQTCIDGYSVTEAGACSVNIMNCVSYKLPGHCDMCEGGYTTFNDTSMCVKTIANCLVYNDSDSTKCLTCNNGYATTESKLSCVKVINHCVEYYDVTGICKECQNNYTLTETSILCAANIANCLVYSDQTQNCKNCSGNLALTQNGAKCVFNVQFCTLFDDISGNCTKCKSGYVLIAGLNSCMKNITNCQAYDQTNGTCQTCTIGFNRSETGRNCYVPIAGCAEIEDFTGKCKICNNPLVRTQTGSKCVNSIKSCASYNDDSGFCLGCSNNLLPSSSGRMCCNSIPNCQTYSDSNGLCSLCPDNYLLTEGGLRCVKSILNCNLYNYTCVLPKNVSNTSFQCSQTIFDCRIYLDPNPDCRLCSTNCTQTENPELPVIPGNLNLNCLGSLTNCEYFPSDTMGCLSCGQGFAPTQSNLKCATQIADCLIYSDLDGLCTACSEPKTINANRTFCLAPPPSDTSNVNLILSVTIPSVSCFLILSGLVFYYCFQKKRKRKPKWISKSVAQENNLQVKLMDNCSVNLVGNDNLVSQSFGHHETKTISLGCALVRIGAFIEKEKKLHEYFVYEIMDDSMEFSAPLQIKIKEKIGKGGYGTVWKAYDYIGNEYALKIFLDKKETDQIEEEDLIRFKEMIKEKMNLRDLKDENIIFIKGIAFSFGQNNKLQLGIVETLMDFDLKGFLNFYKEHLTISRRLEIAMKISVGINYMHYRKCIHNDIKPQNVLLNWENENSKIDVKLSDFGTMQKEIDNNGATSFGITLDYASPERILKSLLDVPLTWENLIKSDIWSNFHGVFSLMLKN